MPLFLFTCLFLPYYSFFLLIIHRGGYVLLQARETVASTCACTVKRGCSSAKTSRLFRLAPSFVLPYHKAGSFNRTYTCATKVKVPTAVSKSFHPIEKACQDYQRQTQVMRRGLGAKAGNIWRFGWHEIACCSAWPKKLV